MLNEQGKPKTSHTTNKVPFVMANAPPGWTLVNGSGGAGGADSESGGGGGGGGVLGDVAPTVLAAMGLDQPEEMSGRSLLSFGG